MIILPLASRLAPAVLALVLTVGSPPAAWPADDLLSPPAWVSTENGAEMQRLSDANSKLPSKQAQKVFDAGIELAGRGADPEEQTTSTETLQRAEQRFTILVEELAPSFYGGWSNRANIRVALKDYDGALADYDAALRLAPLSSDTWVTLLNRGSTLLALDRPTAALEDMQRAVDAGLTTKDKDAERLARLGRASVRGGHVVLIIPSRSTRLCVRL